jgi:hypothetical protein
VFHRTERYGIKSLIQAVSFNSSKKKLSIKKGKQINKDRALLYGVLVNGDEKSEQEERNPGTG